MNKIYTAALVIIGLIIFSGCAQKEIIEANSIIEDVSVLKPSPLNENAFYYIKKDFDIKKYNNIEVPRIRILTDDLERKNIDNILLSRTSIYFRSNLYKELNSVIKDNTNDNTLILNVSIISLDVSYDDLKFYNFLPYSLAFKALKRGTGIEQRKLRVHLALKLIDKNTKETVLIVVDKNVDEEVDSLKDLKFQDIKPVLDKWIELYQIRLFELNSGKYKSTK